MDDSDEDEKVEEEDYEIASDAGIQSDHDTDEVNNLFCNWKFGLRCHLRYYSHFMISGIARESRFVRFCTQWQSSDKRYRLSLGVNRSLEEQYLRHIVLLHVECKWG